MNYALWKKAVSDARVTLAVSSAILIVFCWLFVWLMSFFVLSLVLKFVARMWPSGWWINYFSFLSLFQPQELILAPPPDVWPGLRYDVKLALIALLCYAIAGVVFWRRDIPAPR
jgi:hypothetical protein